MVETRSESRPTPPRRSPPCARCAELGVGGADHGGRRASERGPGEAESTAPRYAVIQDSLQGVLRTPICGQHIHVGMPDARDGRSRLQRDPDPRPAVERARLQLALLVRRGLGAGQLADGDLPQLPARRDGAGVRGLRRLLRVTRQVCAAGGLDDYTHIWWDARIHPALGTIEVRAADTQTELWRAAALAALVHCLPGSRPTATGRDPGPRGARRVELPGHAPRPRRQPARPLRRAGPRARPRRQCLETAPQRSRASWAASPSSPMSRTCSRRLER